MPFCGEGWSANNPIKVHTRKAYGREPARDVVFPIAFPALIRRIVGRELAEHRLLMLGERAYPTAGPEGHAVP
jgi:hypothetical protein